MTESTSDIFSKPIEIENVGKIYPVLMKDYDDFMNYASIISYTYDHFDLNDIANVLQCEKEEIKLLDIIILMAQQSENAKQVFANLSSMFSIVLRKEVTFIFNENNYYFQSNGEYLIDRENYDVVRNVIMHQNLIFVPKVFKNKLTQEWADMVLQTRAKNAVNITTEDMITTIAVMSGKHYWDLENYTYYQIRSEFSRICKIKDYDTMSILFANPYAGEVKLNHFAENMEMHKNPYDDVFKSKSKLSSLDNALGK